MSRRNKMKIKNNRTMLHFFLLLIQIENSKSLQNFTKQHPHLKDKLVVARFKMDGCVHCVNSQPKWDNLMDTINRSYDTHPHLLMIEIDSNVADDFIQQNVVPQ